VPGRVSQTNHSAAIAKVIQAGPYAEALREHTRNIVDSPAFKGSDRSREFLLSVVDKALAGQFDDLKERVLGVEIFGRDASYDTGDDAIVRVTASDVRRRLLRYYAEAGVNSEFQLNLPIGSYIPEFRRIIEAVNTEVPVAPVGPTPDAPSTTAAPVRTRSGAIWGIAGFFMGLAAWGVVSSLIIHKPVNRDQPWATILQPERSLRIVMSDAEISKMQNMLDYTLSLSDYANHKYFPSERQMSDDMRRMMLSFRGLSMGTTDVAIASNISRLAFGASQRVFIVPARSVQLRDFKTDDNFVLLGSPRSNPWVALFEDALDFDFVYDDTLHEEVIRNKRPKAGEPSRYSPSAHGWGTGNAFGIIAFLPNRPQSGHVLLLAGSSAEATEAAAKLATNADQLTQTTRAAGMKSGDVQPFEILLRVDTMAGSPNAWEVAAFHLLR
jgi:hypothetical protein